MRDRQIEKQTDDNCTVGSTVIWVWSVKNSAIELMD